MASQTGWYHFIVTQSGRPDAYLGQCEISDSDLEKMAAREGWQYTIQGDAVRIWGRYKR